MHADGLIHGTAACYAPGGGERHVVTRPVLRYHGGKFRLAPWVLAHFPPHRIYTEAFGGAAGVLVQKPRAYAEVYNDLDGAVVNLFRVLQDEASRRRLTELLVFTPYARAEFDLAWEPAEDPVERARRMVVRAMQGFGSAGATKGTTGFRIDTKREYETAQHTWAMYPANLAAVGQRLTGVLVENRPAIDVIRAHDTADTLHYVDPPYLHETRYRVSKGSDRGYRHEMDREDHLALLDALRGVKGMVVLSGYPSPLYDEFLPGWERRSTKARISGGRGTVMRTECLWLNPVCARALDWARGGLFAGMEVPGA
ncbi:MAG: DNA adenine methylase [Rhodocyclales bacterium]|nr:DNA adenine methylase [Rhodocyclales bacterium]